jgi:hypothetical protein
MIGAATACCVTCGSPTAPDSDRAPIEIRGRIFGQTLQGPQNPNGSLAPDVYVNPVAGAVISTSLDSATTVSDGDGNFVLRTSTTADGQRFALKISAAGYPTYDRLGCWGGRAFAGHRTHLDSERSHRLCGLQLRNPHEPTINDGRYLCPSLMGAVTSASSMAESGQPAQ